MILKQSAIRIAQAFTRWNLWQGGGGGVEIQSDSFSQTFTVAANDDVGVRFQVAKQDFIFIGLTNIRVPEIGIILEGYEYNGDTGVLTLYFYNLTPTVKRNIRAVIAGRYIKVN